MNTRTIRIASDDGSRQNPRGSRAIPSDGDAIIGGVSAYKLSLLVIGAALEFAGIVGVAWPDLVPGAQRLSRWLRPRYARAIDRVRRLLHLRRDVTIHAGSGSFAIGTALSARGTVSVSPHASIEDKVAFLLRREEHNQDAVSDLSQRLTALESETPKRLDDLRASMESHFAAELKAAQEEYLPLRVSGAIALAVGLVCVTLANFV
jgi:hypothetical protein